MSLLGITFEYFKVRLSSIIFYIIMLGISFALISSVIILTDTVKKSIRNNNSNIDLVIGAKGSPLQLVMSYVYHTDIPTGNINYKKAKKFEKHPYVKALLPVSLGDSYKGYRIVGTNENYSNFYKVKIAEGRNISKAFDAVIGSNLSKHLKIGDEFVGNHGLIPNGHSHDEFKYKVVGILKNSNSVVDNLIFTPLESIWLSHAEGSHSKDDEETHKHHHDHQHEKNEKNEQRELNKDNLEITAALIQYKSRSAALTFPRIINSQTNFQSASPSYEITKLLKTLGLGSNYINYFAYFICALTIFAIAISLLKAVSERKKDIALLRVLGAGKLKIFSLITIESMLIIIASIIVGLSLARLLLNQLVAKINLAFFNKIELFKAYNDEFSMIILILIIGFIISTIVANKAASSNIIKNIK